MKNEMSINRKHTKAYVIQTNATRPDSDVSLTHPPIPTSTSPSATVLNEEILSLHNLKPPFFSEGVGHQNVLEVVVTALDTDGGGTGGRGS